MKKIFLIVLLFLFFIPHKVLAQSDYVLPYPSSMPGSKFYVLQEIFDSFLHYWYFGNFGQFAYHLHQSDKYLVEAKTLFEYKQYLLADRALKKSNYYFAKTPLFLINAKKEDKDISQKKKILTSAAQKHIEILNDLKSNLPENFMWTPEKSAATELRLQQDVEKAISVRGKVL